MAAHFDHRHRAVRAAPLASVRLSSYVSRHRPERNMVTPQQVLEELKKVKYPGFARDIVSFGMVKDVEVGSMGVTIILAPTTARDDVIREIRDAVVACVSQMPGVGSVEVSRTEPERPQRRMQQGPAAVPG